MKQIIEHASNVMLVGCSVISYFCRSTSTLSHRQLCYFTQIYCSMHVLTLIYSAEEREEDL